MSPDRNPQASRLYLWPQRDRPGARPDRRVGGRGLRLRSTQGRLPGSGGADTLSRRPAARTRARTALEPKSREAPRFGSFGRGTRAHAEPSLQEREARVTGSSAARWGAGGPRQELSGERGSVARVSGVLHCDPRSAPSPGAGSGAVDSRRWPENSTSSRKAAVVRGRLRQTPPEPRGGSQMLPGCPRAQDGVTGAPALA